MKINFFLIAFMASTMAVLSCSSETDQFDEDAWVDDVETWHNNRIESLRQNDSWLTLAGFYWLDEGRNSFGSESSNDLVFEYDEAPERFGWFIVDGDEVKVELESEAVVTVNRQPIKDMVIYNERMDEPVLMEWENLSWSIIKRGGQYAIRLRDHDHPHLAEFDGIDRFPLSPEWHVRAEFIPFDPPVTITVPNYIGEPAREEILGVLEFEISGDIHRLYPVADNLDERFFLIFADETNGDQTYSAGRFLYTDPPDQNNTVYIDFNKAYNPPCVFSPYATCPLPPPENRLPIAVTAGELDYDVQE